MKPFNLEKALEGDPVITRDGRKVTDIHYFRIKDLDASVMVGIDNTELKSYDTNGKYYQNNDSYYDLFMAPIIKTYWINIYKYCDNTIIQSKVYESKENADNNKQISTSYSFIKTISFEIEE
jgi:hypothetical protein